MAQAGHAAHEVGQPGAHPGAQPGVRVAAPSTTSTALAVCMRCQLTSRTDQKAPVGRGRRVGVRGGQRVRRVVRRVHAVRPVSRRAHERRREVPRGGRDGRAGQAPAEELRVADQHLQHVVEHVARAGAALAEVRLGEEAQRLACNRVTASARRQHGVRSVQGMVG